MAHHHIGYKIYCSAAGFVSGSGITIAIDWEHIVSRSIETGIVALVGGIMGAVGGLLVALMVKKIKKMFS